MTYTGKKTGNFFFVVVKTESPSIIKIYLILEWLVKCEGQTEGLAAMAGMHTYYCNMQTHDSEIIRELVQKSYNPL